MPRLLRPLWLLAHALVVAGCVVMVRLGQWQWGRGAEQSSIQNYSYAIEWYVFAALTLIGWVKICHDELIPDPDAGILHGAVESAVTSTDVAAWGEDDPEVAEWNDRFRELHLRHALAEAGLSETEIRRRLAHPQARPEARPGPPVTDPGRQALS